MSKEQIVRVDPAAAIPGGEVSVECAGYDTSNLSECRATFGGERARLVGAAPWRVLAVVPETLEGGGEAEVVLESGDGQRSGPARRDGLPRHALPRGRAVRAKPGDRHRDRLRPRRAHVRRRPYGHHPPRQRAGRGRRV